MTENPNSGNNSGNHNYYNTLRGIYDIGRKIAAYAFPFIPGSLDYRYKQLAIELNDERSRKLRRIGFFGEAMRLTASAIPLFFPQDEQGAGTYAAAFFIYIFMSHVVHSQFGMIQRQVLTRRNSTRVEDLYPELRQKKEKPKRKEPQDDDDNCGDDLEKRL